jgi:ribosome maturation factor RimP
MARERDLEARVERALASAMPDVDLLELTLSPARGGTLRVVVDHPGGVDHEVCAAVTRVLDDAGLLEEYGAEVWSPGPEPPLRTLEHFRRAVGRRVTVRTDAAHGGRSITGTLVSAGEEGLRLEDAGEVRQVPLSQVRRARALEEIAA